MDKYNKALQNLFDKPAKPNKAFVNGLEKSILSEFKKDNPSIKFISIFNMRINQKIVKYSVLSLAVLGLLGGGLYYTNKTYIQPKRIVEQQKILNLIAQNNPSNYSKTDESKDTVESINTGNSKMSSLLLISSVDRDYNYIKTVNEYEIGQGIDKCRSSVPYSGSVTRDESIQYFKDKTDYMSTDSVYAAYYGSDIYDYTLTVGNESWVYRGGSYAVHTINNVTATSYLARDAVMESVEVDTEDVDYYKLMFGEDAEVLDTVTKDGKKYYKIQWSYEFGCQEYTDSDTISNSSDDRKTYVIALVDAQSYEIVSQDVYIDSISDKNMLYSLNTTIVKKDIAQADVDKEFKFNFNVPVKTYDVSEYDQSDEYKEDLISYLKENKLDVLYLSNTDYGLNSANNPYVITIPEYESHLIDRSFYSSKPYGEAIYNDYKDMFEPYIDTSIVNPVLQLYYSDTDFISSVSVSEYDKTYSDTELIKSLMGEVDANLTENISIAIGNDSITAKVYEVGIEINSVSSGSSGADDVVSDDTGRSEYVTYLIAFVYENRNYMVQVYSNTEQNSSSFESLLKFNKAGYSDSNLLNTVLEEKIVEEVIAY